MKVFCCLTLLSCFIYVVNGDFVVDTNTGKVAGVEINSIIGEEKFYSFYSIPYAEPPIGANKFLAPKPHPGWDDILHNKKEKKACAHFNLPVRHITNYGYTGSEDCLYLSIHTPKLPTKDNPNLPVIVFLYNEHFKIAYNASKDYGPDFFMSEDVVIVTIQHRIGAMGFVSFNDDILPGNNGLRDVILALKWIKSNIQKFGGNQNKITLMGNAGGAVIADLLLHSPKAKGLFNGVILQSGTSWDGMYLYEKGRERAEALAKELEEHVTTSSYFLKRMSPMDTKQMVEVESLTVPADEARENQRGVLAFGPVVEPDHPDAIITEYPENMDLDIDVPIMIGYNSRESIESAQIYLDRPTFLTFADRDLIFLFPYRVNFHFDILSKKYAEAIQEIKDRYFDESYIKVSVPSEYLTYLQDILVFYPIDYTVRKYTNSSKMPVYYYTFDYSGEFNMRKQQSLKSSVTTDGIWGASAGDELCYLFVCKAIKKTYKTALKDEDSEEIRVMKNMVKMWANFARTGNPTPSNEEFQWKPATQANKECLLISDELEMKTNLHESVVTFWDEFIEKYSKLAVDGVIKDEAEKDEL